ncbi:hypothetical protein [Oceanobacillus bengalensis]|uniref:asparagine synthase (glutamine-hydrolyzing) n=1 Tax=Oceanobacillus bengalensis TaxID=1435466 RepID=A0A494Z012_9BACI|nr:hypothetical protein [Oceanobacillus bengalensis]RKQ15825.1 hypothetical protein D8M05_08680 [Oceanobacillus bengalensis]
MHAITGIYHFNQSSVPGSHGYSLMKALHDFPEADVVFWQKQNIFLGGAIPMNFHYDTDGQVMIVADSNIDNKEELCGRLQVEPDKWGKTIDIELILLAYQKWEEETPKYLEGAFSFVVWDDRRQLMFGARDYSGSKLLYYYLDFERFAFCTRMVALLKLPYVEKKLNKDWFQTYMNDSIIENGEDESITPYELIKQVPPGYAFSINEDGMELFSYRSRRSNSRTRQETNSLHEYI